MTIFLGDVRRRGWLGALVGTALALAIQAGPCAARGLPEQGRMEATPTCSSDMISRSGFDTASGSATELTRFGADGWQVPMDIARGHDGTLVTVGNFNGLLDFGPNAGTLTNTDLDDIFVVKMGACGEPMWSKSFGDDQLQSVQRVAIDNDNNIALIGYFRGVVDFGGGMLQSGGGQDIFVAKLDPGGDLLWSRRFGDAQDQFGRGIAIDAEGNIFLTGSFWGTVDFGGGPLSSTGFEDIFLAKLDRDGQYRWAKRYGDGETQEAWDLSADAAGNVVLTGYALGDLDFGDGVTTGIGMPDAVLAKFDGEGNTLWSRRFGDAGQQFGQSVAIDSTGDIVMSGEFSGGVDFGDGVYTSAGEYDAFAAKFDAQGGMIWHQQFGDASNQPSIVVAIGQDDDVLLTGMFEGSIGVGGLVLGSAGSSDVFVLRLSKEGETRWARAMGDGAAQAGTGIIGGSHDDVYVAGKMYGTIEIDGLSATTQNDSDLSFFIAHFSP